MATQREYLAERGLAKPGARGRFSKEATAALAEAKAQGVVFDTKPARPAVTAPVDTSNSSATATV